MYSLQDIASITGGRLLGRADKRVSKLVYDSRKIGDPEHSLFFAFKSSHGDGHQYLSQLALTGIAGAVVTEVDKDADLNYILVEDTVKALQDLARHHRSQHELKVVGITGSNGKTIVKEWIDTLSNQFLSTVKSPKSYNSQIGVPLSLWRIQDVHELGIFEAGISKPGEMQKLADMIQPDVAVFTFLGEAHEANFESRNQKLQEKLILFQGAKIIVGPADNKLFNEAVAALSAKKVLWGRDEGATLRLLSSKFGSTGTTLTVSFEDQKNDFEIPFQDSASLENALSAISSALAIGVPLDQIQKNTKRLQSIDMRLQQVPGINGNSLILDHYNSDIESLRIALEFMKQQRAEKDCVLILSDIQQTGMSVDHITKSIDELCSKYDIRELIAIGPNLQSSASSITLDNATFFSGTQDFIRSYPLYTLANKVILLKGARSFQFEKISERLRIQVHQTMLEVNMSRLEQNLKFHQARLPASCKTMAMVKAFGYGVGGVEIARLMELNKIHYLGVAYIDEAIGLREAGITSPILILNPDFSKAQLMSEYRIEPSVYSMESLNALQDFLGDEEISVHIEVDTGMHRLGFEPDEIPSLIERLKSLKQVNVRSVFSHLPAADDPQHDTFTRAQFLVFKKLVDQIKQQLGKHILSHMSNTSGIQRFPEEEFDMVRLGIGLYGVSSEPDLAKHLEPVVSFKSYIAQIRNVKPGDGVGYGLHNRADKERKVAVVAVGYADGYSRGFSQQKGAFLIAGKRAPILGNVCMDMTMCDVTDIDCKTGDEVVIFGDDPSVDELAETLGTIPYEVLSSISQRVNRIYYQE